MILNPAFIVDIPAKPRTLESLVEKYTYMVMSPVTAQMALAERQEIMFECDRKNYQTEEDTLMMDYLWRVHNQVVDNILRADRQQVEKIRSGSC